MIIAAIDVETTGFRSTHVVTQVAGAVVDVESCSISHPIHFRIHLTEDEVAAADAEALAITKWTPEDNAQATPREEAVRQFDAWMHTTRPGLTIAHNATFDRRMCVAGRLIHQEVPWACTMKGLKEFQKLHRRQLPDNKLSTLAELCGYQQTAAHVSALDDAYVVANGLLYLLSTGVPVDRMRL